MFGYILKRFAYSIFTLFVIITITFFIMHAIPGNVYNSEKNLPPAIVENIRAKYGLDKPLSEQYITMLKNTIKLDFGISMKNRGRPVNDIITEHFPHSARLGIFSITLCLFIGIPLGVLSALKKDKWQDRMAMIIATLGVSVPGFVVAVLSQYLLGVKLKWFPVIGDKSFIHLILPAVALSFLPISLLQDLYVPVW